MERWDAYNSDFQNITGMTLVRGEPIPEGCFHLVCEIIVLHDDGTYLLMQRDKKKHFGGMWEASAGGSALVGESPSECAVRELREETGILSDDLTEIGRVLHRGHQTIYVEYLCRTDMDKNHIILQEEETSGFRWVNARELRYMSPDELVTHRIQCFVEELSEPSFPTNKETKGE